MYLIYLTKNYIDDIHEIQPDEKEKIIGPKIEKNKTSWNNESRKIIEYINK